MTKPKEFEHLIDAIRSLPNIGLKSANKIAHFILKQDDKYIRTFILKIKEAHDYVKICKTCGNIAVKDECAICLSSSRDRTKICVVSNIDELDRIEDSKLYNGLYHITNGEISFKKNVLVEHTNINSLIDRIDNDILEVIIATNFTHDGEMTAQYIKEILSKKDIIISRIGFGIPLNASVDYADNETLKHSFNNRRKI